MNKAKTKLDFLLNIESGKIGKDDIISESIFFGRMFNKKAYIFLIMYYTYQNEEKKPSDLTKF